MKVIADIIMGKKTKISYKDTFTNNQMARYLKFIIIEEGLNGFFAYRSPREFIEGYDDPLLYELYN